MIVFYSDLITRYNPSSQKDNYRDLYDIIIAPTVFDVPITSFLFLASLMQCKPPQYCYADISLYELLVSSLSLQLIKSCLVV
jgi:hypothetical protein